MRSLTLVTILCLTSTPAIACVFDTECKPGTTCVDGNCGRDLLSGSDDVPAKRSPSKGKTCGYDGDCDPGSRCFKGSGLEGVCLGH
jgi:hypothetical protein